MVLVILSNYKKIEIEMCNDKTCIIENNKVSIDYAINYANKLVSPSKILRADIFNLIEKEVNGKIQNVYVFLKSLKLYNKIELTFENKKFIKNLGYTDNDFSLSNVIKWIRDNKKFNIWVEHGCNNTHDITTSKGCHRGAFKTYEEAQLEGIQIFIKIYA